MGRRKLDNKKINILSTRMVDEKSDKVRFISKMLGMNVARFIDMCIQEWMSNHSDFIKLLYKELNDESRRESNS